MKNGKISSDLWFQNRTHLDPFGKKLTPLKKALSRIISLSKFWTQKNLNSYQTV